MRERAAFSSAPHGHPPLCTPHGTHLCSHPLVPPLCSTPWDPRPPQVRPYRLDETQAILELYAMVGHMHNAAIDGQLRNGELANKVRLMTSGVAEDVFKLAQQM
jgi:hypothetical protein